MKFTEIVELDAIDTHVETHLDSWTEKVLEKATAQQRLINLCAIYQAVRPIIKFVRGLLFWKHKWQLVIDQFTESMDANCQTVGE